MAVTHAFVSAKSDGGDATLVRPSNWNADHAITGVISVNGTTATAIQAYNTYTDASNYERGTFDWTTASNKLTIGMQKAGTGTARDVHIVTDVVRLKVDNVDGVHVRNFADSAYLNIYALGFGSVITQSAFLGADGSRFSLVRGIYAPTAGWEGLPVVALPNDGLFGWSSTTTNTATRDTGLARNAAGVVEINNGTVGTLRDIKARDITLTASSSLTPANNGELVIQATSNTSLTFKYKGSDGTVRSASLTLT
jgi:hypothetical protein